jgi:uncharacterized damage-inducible protein DinB
MQSDLGQEFIRGSVFRLSENTPRIRKCLDALTEDQLWLRPNEASNSIGNLILHLCGNIRQYAISSLSGAPDSRERDKEFSARSVGTRIELLAQLETTVAAAITVIQSLDDAALLHVRSVQGFDLSGMAIVIHVTEHYSYHTGQIAFWTKLLTDKDLGFYAGLNLNTRNAG